MKLALLTCFNLPGGDKDDRHLVQAFQQRHVDIEWLIWDQIKYPVKHNVALIRSVWDYHNKPASFLKTIKKLSQKMTVLNPPQVVQWNSEKTYLRDLQKAGLPVAETHWINQLPNAEEFAQLLNTVDTDEWFIKPVIGADASGTLRFKADRAGVETAMSHLQQHLTHSGMMLQPFLPSVADQGELSIIYMGEQLTHAVIKKPKAGDYRVQDTFGGVDCVYEIGVPERIVADQCMAYLWQRFEPLCYARLDFLRDLTGQWVINEVELIEPSLFFRHQPNAADRLVDAVLKQA